MLKDIRPIKGKYYIHRLIEEGEHEHQDFKFQISDARKIARSLSAFANNDGGRLLIGVKDNGVVAGVRSEEDIYMIEAAARTYCRPEVEVNVTAFLCEEGAVVIRASIARAQRRPVYVREEGDRLKAYIRVADENIVVPELMLRTWERAEWPEGELLTFSAAERMLLQMLERRERVDPDRFHIAAHLSRQAAEDAITRLASMGVIAFTYTAGKFQLTKAQ